MTLFFSLPFLAKSDGTLALLEVDPGLTLWTFIIFGIVFLFLRKFAWRPIGEALAVRSQKIHEDLKKAEELKLQAEKSLDDYLKKLETAEETAKLLLKDTLDDANKEKENIILAAKEEATRVKEKAVSEINEVKSLALTDLSSKIIDFSMDITEKVLAKTINQEEHKRLTEEALKELSRDKKNAAKNG